MVSAHLKISNEMISTKNLFLGIIGEYWESFELTGFESGFTSNDVTIVKKKEINGTEKFVDIFTETEYEYRSETDSYTITQVRQLKPKAEYVSLEVLEEPYKYYKTEFDKWMKEKENTKIQVKSDRIRK